MKTKPNGVSPIGSAIHSSIFSRDAVIENMTSKLLTPVGKGSSDRNTTNLPSPHELQPIFKSTMQSSIDADHAFNVLPDLEMVAQISISSILSSKDLITTTLMYDSNCDALPFELRNTLIKITKDHFDDVHKLPRYLYDILYDVMFKTGSYPVAIVPESAVDMLIKSGREGVGKESIQERLKGSMGQKGIFGSIEEPVKNTGLGLESLVTKAAAPASGIQEIKFGDSGTYGSVVLTDNIDVLKLPNIQKSITRKTIKDTYNTVLNSTLAEYENVGVEAVNEINIDATYSISAKTATGDDLSKFDNRIYNDSRYATRMIEEMPTATAAKRPNFGNPLILHIPSEAVIPVHVPGDFKSHVGYLVLIDRLGNPVSRHDMMNNIQAWSWIAGDASSSSLKDAAEGLGFGRPNQEKWTMAKLTESYSDLVDRKLKNALQNGVYGDSATMTKPQEVYRIMLARSLAKKQTQILYIPVEQMTYFAFDYNDNGIGVSLTEKNKVITSGRAAIMFATLQSSVLNATRNMEYSIQLAATDREPEKTIDDAKHRIMQGYGGRIPFTGSINDMEAYFTNAGISFNVEGNDYYPSTKITVADNTPDYKVPDPMVEEMLAKRNYRGFGVDPDLVMSPGSIEFATQVLSKDLMTTKQVCQRQEKFAPMLTQYCRTYAVSSGDLLSDLAEACKDYFSTGTTKLKAGELGHYLNQFVEGLDVTLPPPDMSLLASQMDAFAEEEKAIDALLEVFVDDTIVDQLGDGTMDSTKARGLVGNFMKRNWFRTNGVMPDLIEMLDDVEKRSEMVKSIADDNINIATFLLMTNNRVNSRMGTLRNALVKESDDSYSDDGMGGDDTGGGDDDFGDGGAIDDGGFDDFDNVDADEDADVDVVDEESDADVEDEVVDVEADADTEEDTAADDDDLNNL